MDDLLDGMNSGSEDEAEAMTPAEVLQELEEVSDNRGLFLFEGRCVLGCHSLVAATELRTNTSLTSLVPVFAYR